MNWLLWDGNAWGLKSLWCSVLRLLSTESLEPFLIYERESSSLGSTFISTSLDFIPSNSTAVADFELLNSFASGLYVLIDKFAFAYGQIILYLEKYSYCVFYSIEPSRVKCSLDA